MALPAVAFDLVAGESRLAAAVLDGTTAAFVLRFGLLCIPLVLVLVVSWLPRGRVGPAR